MAASLVWTSQLGEAYHNQQSEGIMTFIVNQNGVTFQKDLGKSTDDIASAMTSFDPDGSWQVADSQNM
jgi:Protein of unknown function (DUF2950)